MPRFLTVGQQGPDVLLIHGYCEDKSLWGPFQQMLSNRFRVTAIDLPGFGENPTTQDPITIEWLADETALMMLEAGIRKAVVVGHSLGGYVALALAERHPELFSGLCMFHSSALADTPEQQEMRDKVAASVRQIGAKKFVESFFPNLVSPRSYKQFRSEIDALVARFSTTDPESIAKTSLAMKNRPDRTSVLRSLKVPVMFIAGKEDPRLPFELILQQAALPANCTSLFLDEVGHLGMIESSRRTYTGLAHFAAYCNQ